MTVSHDAVEASLGRGHEVLDDRQRVGRSVRKRTAERGTKRDQVDRAADRASRERGAVVARDLGRALEQAGFVSHLGPPQRTRGRERDREDRLMLP